MNRNAQLLVFVCSLFMLNCRVMDAAFTQSAGTSISGSPEAILTGEPSVGITTEKATVVPSATPTEAPKEILFTGQGFSILLPASFGVNATRQIEFDTKLESRSPFVSLTVVREPLSGGEPTAQSYAAALEEIYAEQDVDVNLLDSISVDGHEVMRFVLEFARGTLHPSQDIFVYMFLIIDPEYLWAFSFQTNWGLKYQMEQLFDKSIRSLTFSGSTSSSLQIMQGDGFSIGLPVEFELEGNRIEFDTLIVSTVPPTNMNIIRQPKPEGISYPVDVFAAEVLAAYHGREGVTILGGDIFELADFDMVKLVIRFDATETGSAEAIILHRYLVVWEEHVWLLTYGTVESLYEPLAAQFDESAKSFLISE
jgi:hypothetical protein